jgi:hypothetical protein
MSLDLKHERERTWLEFKATDLYRLLEVSADEEDMRLVWDEAFNRAYVAALAYVKGPQQ